MVMKTKLLEELNRMAFDLVKINRETGNVAALVLCDIQADLNRIADGLVWGR